MENCSRCGESCTDPKPAVSEATRAYLERTRYSCLCGKCLSELEEIIHTASGMNFPLASGQLIKGVHYYEEDGRWVFTETYHILRGYCCRSGCRHCAYGYRR